MSEDDTALWQAYAKGVRRIDAPEEAAPSVVTKKEEKAEPQPERINPPQTFKPFVPEPLDVRIERNLSLGEVVVEARLDLHGSTEEEAHTSFLAFIDRQTALGRRLVLVITGKGKDGRSVLRTNLPRWCEVPPLCDRIRAVRTAAAHHGGDGAYYILLRKGGKS